MKKNLILVFLIGIILTSCTITRNTCTVSNIDAYIAQYPTVAEIEVGEKVEMTTSWISTPFNQISMSKEIQTNNLISDILRKYDANVLIEPQTVYIKKSFGRRSITVTGYPAFFKNIRKATDNDLENLREYKEAHKATIYPLNFNGRNKENRYTEVDKRFFLFR